MRKMRKWFLLPLLGVIWGCGGGDLGSGAENEFESVILYVNSVEPQPLQSDVIEWYQIPVNVNAVDPTIEIAGDGVGNDNGICEEGEVCCGDVGPSYPNFQSVCCRRVTTAQVCAGKKPFSSDSVNINFVLEPKKNYKGEPISSHTSPVLLQNVSITYRTLTEGCPDLPSVHRSVGFTIQPDEEVHTYALSLVSQITKENLFNSLSSPITYTYVGNDGCQTDVPVYALNKTCEYQATASFTAVELLRGVKETVDVAVDVRIGDFQSSGDECTPEI